MQSTVDSNVLFALYSLLRDNESGVTPPTGNMRFVRMNMLTNELNLYTLDFNYRTGKMVETLGTNLPRLFVAGQRTSFLSTSSSFSGFPVIFSAQDSES